jgi:branched-chain amino acid aminotransferase
VNVWLDGRLVPVDEAKVSVLDHGLTVGDGVFETVKVVDGTPFALTRHLRRLAASARGLGLAEPDEQVVRGAVGEVLAAAGPEERASARLRITVTGGPSPLGSSRGDSDPTLVVALAPLSGWEETTSLVTVPWTRNERSAVAGLKTTSYAENVVALAYAHERDASEALFLNTRGEVCEGTGSNVFAVIDGTVVTPPLDSGCLAGVTRALVLEWCGGEERAISPAELTAADEVFLASTTRDIQAVRRVDDRSLPAPGPVTSAAQRVFAQRAAADVDP